MSACEGLRVVELAEGMAGPLAGQILADYGADVLKIEPPGGDWARGRPGFSMWNRGKRSVVLDLREEDQLAEALDLLSRADVVLISWRSGVAMRLGLDYERVAAVNPGIIWGEISGFGSIPELRDVQGYEGLVSAAIGKMSGLDHLSGAAVGHRPDEPLFTYAPANTYSAANLLLQGVLAALMERKHSGLGQKVETSLVHGASAGTMRYAFSRDSGKESDQLQLEKELRHKGIMVVFTTAECSDGKWIQMCARQDHHFRNWMEAMGLGYLMTEERYGRGPLHFQSYEDIDELDGLIRDRMRQRTQEEWMRIFIEDVDVGADPLLTPEEFMHHPQMVENGRIVEIEDPELGLTTQPGPIALLSETPPAIAQGAPLLGDDRGGVDWELRADAKPALGSDDDRPAGPLSGVTILEVGHYLAGPLGATVLAELGARVIKVEPVTGDSFRRVGLEFVHLAHGKESIALDLKSEKGREVLYQLVDKSDALLHNFRPGVPERLGFGYEQIHERNPRLVYVYAGSYGSKGKQSHRAAMHSTPIALCGSGIIQAGEGNPPVDESWPDPAAGIGVATGMMLGLVARERTGNGQYVETTMLTSAAYVYSDEMVMYPGRPPAALLDHEQRGPNALNRLYECSDGWILLGVHQDDEWLRLGKSLGGLGLTEDCRFADRRLRAKHNDELIAILKAEFAQHSAQALVASLRQYDVPIVALLPGAGFEKALVQRGFMEEAEHPAFGSYWKHPPTTHFSRSVSRVRPPCGLGEHTVEILEELGYSSDQIQALEADGVVVVGQF